MTMTDRAQSSEPPVQDLSDAVDRSPPPHSPLAAQLNASLSLLQQSESTTIPPPPIGEIPDEPGLPLSSAESQRSSPVETELQLVEQRREEETREQGSPLLKSDISVAPKRHSSSAHEPGDKGTTNRKAKKNFTAYEKLGVVTTLIWVLGWIFILSSLGFLWFLWLADYHNSTWHEIAYRNFFTRAVSLSSLAIRNAVSLQASAATSMIASLALEQVVVLLVHLASVSVTRNANGGPYMLTWWVLKAFARNSQRWKHALLPILVTMLTIITILIQFTSTALLSDVDSIVIPGPSTSSTVASNFAYNTNGTIPLVTRGTTWAMKPPFYPTFAEYHEQPPTTPDGVVDTGLTLRAFTPIQQQQSRDLLNLYSGRATVLDARVVCMRPNLTDEKLHLSNGVLAFEGRFNAPFNTSRLIYLNNTLDGPYEPISDWYDRPRTNFTCLAPISLTAFNNSDYVESSVWRLSICQPTGYGPGPGLLLSEFRTPAEEVRPEIEGEVDYSFGTTYLAINVSSGDMNDWQNALSEEDPSFGVVKGPGTTPQAYSNHGEWLDLLFSSDDSLRISISLCFTAFDTADLKVNMDGPRNRTEPAPTYDIEKGMYLYNSIRAQLGQSSDGDVSYDGEDIGGRGILSLQPRSSWLPDPNLGDYVYSGQTYTGTSWITDFCNMGGPEEFNSQQEEIGYDTTAFLYNANREVSVWSDIESLTADPSTISLVQEIIQSGGSMAFAMQSIITVLSGIAYYDQLQQFNDRSSATQTDFISVTGRTRFRGLIAVTAVIIAHLLFSTLILVFFLLGTNLSNIGNSWQAVAQVRGEVPEPLLELAQLGTESNVERALGSKERQTKIVGIGMAGDGTATEIIEGRKDLS